MGTLTDEQVDGLLARVTALQTKDDDGELTAWTWLDADPDVAWRDPDSYHGKLAALYIDAGWEVCYHRDARFHYNVKIRGGYQVTRDAVFAANLNDDAQARVFERLDAYNEQDIQAWWEFGEAEDFLANLDPPRTFSRYTRDGVYSCGKSGGYANCDGLKVYPEAMIRLAQFLGQAVDYYESAEYATELVERAMVDDKAEMMMALASPRPQRIEA